MATLIKKNETFKLSTFKNGVSLQFFVITFSGDVSTLLGATAAGVRSPVAAAFDSMAQAASIEIIGAGNGTTTVNFAIAALGGANNDTIKWDGTNSETFTAYLDRLAKLPGSLQGITVTSVGALTF